MRLVAAAAVAALLSPAAAVAETWDMPMAYSDSNFHTQNGKAFAACVGAGTGGAIEITVHGGGSLFKGNDIKRAVQTAQAPIGERLMSAHANENAVFGVDSVPFLATSFDDSVKLWAATEPTMAAVLAEQNLVLLYSVPWPPQGLYSKKPVTAVADLAGVKFRAYNSATARMAELTGMLPVQVEAAELTQALATGVAEAFISSGATGYDLKVWEHVSHFYEVDAWLPRNHVFVNKQIWDALPADQHAAIMDCADKAEVAGLQAARDYTSFTLKGLAEGGMTVGPAGEALTNELKAIGETMTAEWLQAAGATGQAIVDAYKAQ